MTIPTKKSQVFSAAVDGQTTIEVKIYQGEHELVRDNKLLGNFDLVGIPPAPKGVAQIEITFNIDADSIVNVSAKDKATNKDHDKDIEHMVSDAEQFTKSDKACRDLIDESNKAMNEFKDQLNTTEKEKVTKLVTELCKLAARGQPGDGAVTSEQIREKINETC
ncbi:heat shock protein 70 [Suillus hirtellus]|nr:heat shock protein 70 [Suillus hirtellus]